MYQYLGRIVGSVCFRLTPELIIHHFRCQHPLPQLTTFPSDILDSITPDWPQLPHWQMVPQLPYLPAGSPRKWDPKASIHFLTSGNLGLRLSDALESRFEGLNDRDAPAFDTTDCSGLSITIRIHVGLWGNTVLCTNS